MQGGIRRWGCIPNPGHPPCPQLIPKASGGAGGGAGGALTLDGGSLGQDGDGSLGHVLLLQQRAHLGAPGVRAHPQEMSHLVCPLGSCQDLPVERNAWVTVGSHGNGELLHEMGVAESELHKVEFCLERGVCS